MSESFDPASARGLFEAHPRSFQGNRYVYPVLSRRAGGVSIGVNLNPDKLCNFDCIYCQVDRAELAKGGPENDSGTVPIFPQGKWDCPLPQRPGDPADRPIFPQGKWDCPLPKPGSHLSAAPKEGAVEIDRLAAELDAMVRLVASGRIYENTKFRRTPPALRRLNDIALSGDGEPTACERFEEAVAACVEVRRRHCLDAVKLVLLTNASLLDRQRVRRGLELLDANNGELWAKLDAGTEAYYQQVARSGVPFQRILDNLRAAALVRPIVIQSLFMRIRGEPTPPDEQQAFCERLREILAAGGRIRLVQLHTIARPAAESWVAPLSNEELDALAALVRQVTSLPVAAFYGLGSS